MLLFLIPLTLTMNLFEYILYLFGWRSAAFSKPYVPPSQEEVEEMDELVQDQEPEEYEGEEADAFRRTTGEVEALKERDTGETEVVDDDFWKRFWGS